MSAKYIYDWLRLLFGSTVAGDMFQEKLDGVLKSVPSTTSTAHEVLCHGNAEIRHNAENVVFILSKGIRDRSQNVQAITEMKAPQNFKIFKAMLVWRTITIISAQSWQTAPLRALCRKGVVLHGRAHIKKHLKLLRKKSHMHQCWEIWTGQRQSLSSQMHPRKD